MSATAIQQAPPSMAQIVREVTDDGRRIVEFYLGVADGSLEGFEVRHRMSAARRLDKIAPGLVAKYLQKHYNSLCRDSYRVIGVLPVRRSPIRPRPAADGQGARRPSAFRRRLAQLVREETGDGRAIVDFMAGVMHGTITAFKPHHRLEAAKELAAHITTNDPTPAVRAPVVRADPRVRPLNTEPEPTKPARPEPTQPVRPEPTQPARPEPVEGQCSAKAPQLETKNQKLTTKNFPPITIDEIKSAGYLPRDITRYKFARDQITGAVYAFDELGPFIVDEDGDETFHISPDQIAGYGNVPFQTFEESDIPDKPARKRPRLFTGPPNEENLTIAERRIRQKLKDHWHEPDPLAGTPFFPSHPGRSPPW